MLYVALLLLWIVFSIPAGLVLGRGIHVADVLRRERAPYNRHLRLPWCLGRRPLPSMTGSWLRI